MRRSVKRNVVDEAEGRCETLLTRIRSIYGERS